MLENFPIPTVLIVVSLLYFWFVAIYDVFVISKFDAKAQQVASLAYVFHFFFLITLSVFILSSLK